MIKQFLSGFGKRKPSAFMTIREIKDDDLSPDEEFEQAVQRAQARWDNRRVEAEMAYLEEIRDARWQRYGRLDQLIDPGPDSE
jgi:hypothetical protein